MCYADGWAAMNLEMPSRVPRSEFDAAEHWELVTAVTGQVVSFDSPRAVKLAASQAFMRAWNYDLALSGTIYGDIFGDLHTSMGHAVYADGGIDYNNRLFCPFSTPEEVLAFDPWTAYGTRAQGPITQRFNEQYAQTCANFPMVVNTAGIYVTCVSGLIDIFGWDMLLMAAGTDPVGFGEVTNRYASWILQYYEALANSDVPVIYSHDDIVWTAGPFIHPEWYRTYVFPNLKKLYAPLVEAGKKVIFLSDGNYTQFVDDIAACGVHGFFCEPLTDLAYLAERYGRTHVLIGNADTRILLYGSREEIRAEVERCLAIGRHCPGYFMGVTNMIPPNTPVASALYYNEVYEALSRR